MNLGLLIVIGLMIWVVIRCAVWLALSWLRGTGR